MFPALHAHEYRSAARAAPGEMPRIVQAKPPPNRPSTVNCTWKMFTQPLDHFGGGAAANTTFEQRVCIFSAYHTAPDGPIFFYTGNESPVDEYVNNTGLMWEIGERLGALLLFAPTLFLT